MKKSLAILLLLLLLLLVVGCGEKSVEIADPSVEEAIPVEEAIRKELKKPTGELTRADFEKVTRLDLRRKGGLNDVKLLERLTQLEELFLSVNWLTDVKGLEKLTQLKTLDLSRNNLTDLKGLEKFTQLTFLKLSDNPALTPAQIDQLQKALPKCEISSNPYAYH